MINHVVSFRWKAETHEEHVAAIRDALATMPANVPKIGTYRYGSDLGVNPTSNMDFAIVATFDSVDDWRAYDSHPYHEQVRNELIRPWIDERISIQFES